MEIMKGWEPFSFTSNSLVGVLVLQGFTGSTSSVYPLGEYLAKSGFNVEGPRLAGHGTKWQDLNHVHYIDWLVDVEQGLEKLKQRCTTIFVAGLSMGGALSLYLAEKYPDIKGIILINNAIFIEDPRAFLLPVLRFLIQSTPGISSDIKDPNQKEVSYNRTPTKGVYEMSKLFKFVRMILNRINQPLLIFKSREDHVLSKEHALWVYDHVLSQNKEMIWLENSYHVATMDYDKEIIFQKSVEFIKRYCD